MVTKIMEEGRLHIMYEFSNGYWSRLTTILLENGYNVNLELKRNEEGKYVVILDYAKEVAE